MLSDRSIVDCIIWLIANIRECRCYGLVVKPLHYDYFFVFFCAVIKTMSFSANRGQFFKRGAQIVPVCQIPSDLRCSVSDRLVKKLSANTLWFSCFTKVEHRFDTTSPLTPKVGLLLLERL